MLGGHSWVLWGGGPQWQQSSGGRGWAGKAGSLAALSSPAGHLPLRGLELVPGDRAVA